MRTVLLSLGWTALLLASPANASSVIFNSGDPDGLLATASRPASAGKIETETADDFILSKQTRNNLTFSVSHIANSFSAANSIISGIHPLPNVKTGGEGQVSGEEVRFNVTFSTPINLPADHYFFRPEVGVSSGEFLWLSAPKPIGAGGTPINPDLQSWIRNSDLAPDWERTGADIIGAPTDGGVAPTFNASFSVTGSQIPLPPAFWPGVGTLVLLAAARVHRHRQATNA
jgi:hypothetical protein